MSARPSIRCFLQFTDGRRAFVHQNACNGKSFTKGQHVVGNVCDDAKNPGKWMATWCPLKNNWRWVFDHYSMLNVSHERHMRDPQLFEPPKAEVCMHVATPLRLLVASSFDNPHPPMIEHLCYLYALFCANGACAILGKLWLDLMVWSPFKKIIDSRLGKIYVELVWAGVNHFMVCVTAWQFVSTQNSSGNQNIILSQ